MTRPVLSLVHGMGEFSDGWADTLVNGLNGIITDQLEIVPLGYDHVLRRQVQNWRETAEELRALSGEDGQMTDLLDWIEDAGTDNKKFIWSYAMDVILYRFHPPTRRLILTGLIEQMAAKISQILLEAPMTPVSVMAHGLGTAVVHDAIHHLGAHRWGGQPNGFGPNIWRFRCITMLSNVSRLLESDLAQPESIVRPGPRPTYGHY